MEQGTCFALHLAACGTKGTFVLTTLRMHAIARSVARRHAPACISYAGWIPNARLCVQSGTTPRTRVHFVRGRVSKCTSLRIDRHDAPQSRALPAIGKLRMHAIAGSVVRRHAPACISYAGGQPVEQGTCFALHLAVARTPSHIGYPSLPAELRGCFPWRLAALTIV